MFHPDGGLFRWPHIKYVSEFKTTFVQ